MKMQKNPEAATTQVSKMSAGKPVGAVVSALRVLRHLVESGEPLSSNRIARELTLNPSTCFNILKTLEQEGFVHCDSETKRHRPGLMLLELAGGAMDNLGYRQMLRPYLDQVARATRTVVSLWVRSGPDRAVLVDSTDGGAPIAGPIKIVMPIGSRVPLLAGGLGRCFAGYGGMNRTTLRKLFARVRWNDAPSFDTFMEEAEKAVRLGYAVDAQNYAKDIVTVSAPVVDREGKPTMALSAVTLANVVDARGIAAIGKELAQAAEAARRATWAMPSG